MVPKANESGFSTPAEGCTPGNSPAAVLFIHVRAVWVHRH